MKLSKRLVLSVLSGLFLSGSCLLMIWCSFRANPDVRQQASATYRNMGFAIAGIDNFQKTEHRLPKSQEEFDTIISEGASQGDWQPWCLDGWGRKFHYWTDGKHYRITSYGRDNKPGGVGLDFDIARHDVIENDKETENLYRWPDEAFLTFRQLYVETPFGHKLILSCALPGLAVIILGMLILSQRKLFPERLAAIVVECLITLIAALYTAVFMALMYIPSGH
jgi:hypothetical protein